MPHYAFLVDDELVDRAYARLRAAGAEHRADLHRTRPGETDTEHGGVNPSTPSATPWS